MLTAAFARPVSVVKGGILVHRKIPCQHVDSAQCACTPWFYSQAMLMDDNVLELMNARLDQERQ